MGVVEQGLLPAPIARAMGWARSRTMRVHPVLLGCCDRGMRDLLVGTAASEAARRGVRQAATPEAATVIAITGAVTRRSADDVLAVVARAPQPRLVVAVGDCACGHGPFAGRAATVPVDEMVAVDARIEGCDLDAADILAGLRSLADDVRTEDPAVRWAAARGREPQASESLVLEVPLNPGRCHRGVEEVLATLPLDRAGHGAAPGAATVLAHVDGGSEVALPLAFAWAVEDLLGIAASVPPRAVATRALLLELSHVESGVLALRLPVEALGAVRLGGRATTVAAAVRDARLSLADGTATVVPGGLAVEPRADLQAGVLLALTSAGRWLAAVRRQVLGSARVERVLRGLGELSADDAIASSVSGAALRASGADLDPRLLDRRLVDHPGTAPWRLRGFAPFSHPAGDTFGRLWVRAVEGERSSRFAAELLDAVPDSGAVLLDAPSVPATGAGEALVEHPLGSMLCRVDGAGGPVPWRVRVASPSSQARPVAARLSSALRPDDALLVASSFAIASTEADR